MPGSAVTRVRGAVLAGVLSLAAVCVFAQATGTTTGDLRGQVRDDAGTPLSGVEVTAANRENGLTRSATTGEHGEFVLRFLPPGSYGVTAVQKGLQTLRVERVGVAVGSTAQLELTMALEPVAESVTVDAGSQPLDLASIELATAITETEIRNLPINRRNFLDFALTTPGVTLDRGPQTGAATTSGFSVNGQDPRLNNVLLDGLDDNDAAVGAVRSAVPQEAVREYQVIRAPYSPEYGRTGGGVINVVTRSGSNGLRGTAFLFYRDESLSAEHPLTGTKTPYQQFQFGAAVSGPILPDRLFYFAAAERLDVTDANVVTIDENVAQTLTRAGFPVEAGAFPFRRDRTSVFAKLDAAPSPSQAWALRGTWSTDTDENQQPWGGTVARSGGGVRDIEDGALGLTGISLFGASASNELRALYTDRTHRLESLDPTGGPSIAILGFATFGTQAFLPQPRDSRTFQAFDAVSFFRGQITGKAGFDYVHTDLKGSLPLYFAGLYQFAPVTGGTAFDDFENGIPAAFVQGFGDPAREVSTDRLGVFVQAEWTAGSRLVIRAGLRYDYENPADPFPADSDNLAPRLSFSCAPGERWRVRGGLGRFYAVAPIGPMFAVGVLDGTATRILLRTLQEDPFDVLTDIWGQPNHRFANEAEAGDFPPAVFRPGRFESAHTDLASLGVETDLGRGWSASLDYLHARGRAILVERDLNPIDPTTKPPARPYPEFRDIRLYESTGNSWYDGITASLKTGLAGPLQVAASYTYADAENDYIDFSVGQPQDPLDPDGELGPTVHVPRHRATLAAVCSTPRTGRWWTRDWTLSAISDISIGRPYNQLAGFDRNGNGDPASDRPEGVGRDEETLPTYWNVDLRVGRRIPLQPLELEATLEIFNLFNRTNVLEVNNVRYRSRALDENPDFGHPTRVADPARLQFGLRVTF